MSKPHWQKLHENRLLDIRFFLEEIWAFKLLLRKHPDDQLGERFRDVIKRLKKCLDLEIRGYTEIYGDKPDVVLLRREVECPTD